MRSIIMNRYVSLFRMIINKRYIRRNNLSKRINNEEGD